MRLFFKERQNAVIQRIKRPSPGWAVTRAEVAIALTIVNDFDIGGPFLSPGETDAPLVTVSELWFGRTKPKPMMRVGEESFPRMQTLARGAQSRR